MKNRLEYMDWVRGMAMCLVVAGHALLGMYESGAFVRDEIFLYIAKEILYSFHMPLFFMTAGFFYGKKRPEKSEILPFLRRKFLSFGIPYLIFAIIQRELQLLGGGTVRSEVTAKEFLTLLIRPVDHLWFLWAIFLCFLVSVLLDFLIKNVNVVFGICILLAILSVNIDCKNPALEYIFEYPFFFYLGKMIWKYQLKLAKWNKWFAIFIGFLLLAGTNGFCFLVWRFPGNYYLTGTGGIILFYFLAKILAEHKDLLSHGLIKLGQITMPVYLFHAPIMSVARIVLIKIGVRSTWTVLIILIAFSLTTSCLGYEVVRRVPILDRCIYPCKRR